MYARSTLEQFLAAYTNPESHNAQRYRQTDGQTDGQKAAANSRSYCVAVRSAKNDDTLTQTTPGEKTANQSKLKIFVTRMQARFLHRIQLCSVRCKKIVQEKSCMKRKHDICSRNSYYKWKCTCFLSMWHWYSPNSTTSTCSGFTICSKQQVVQQSEVMELGPINPTVKMSSKQTCGRTAVVNSCLELLGSTFDGENVPASIIHWLTTRHPQSRHLANITANLT